MMSRRPRHRLVNAENKPGIERLESRRLLATTAPTIAAPVTLAAGPARQMEYLDRGVVAVRATQTSAYISWRLLGNDPNGISFNLYRSANGAAAVKLNTSPLTTTTDFTDTTLTTTVSNRYFIRPVIGGVEQADSPSFTLAANAPVRQYLSIPITPPPGGHLPGTTDTVEHDYTYTANDTSVGDVDGDGQYEYIVKWEPSDAKDNSQDGYTGDVYVDAYRLNGTRLWRINLGKNIRAGAHYTQFQVYDFDGDGRAEVAMKTAPGTVDGLGSNVILAGDDPNADYRNSEGYVLAGPEYLTMFNGLTGAAMSTVRYVVPRHPTTDFPTSSQLNSVWGDGYGNRVDRFLGGVAYLDGQRPSLVMARGYYTRSTITAWDFRNGQLTQRWLFDSNTAGSQYRGQGNHNLSIGDVDADGKDEIIYGAMAVNDDGTGMYSTGWGHGDALHVSDFLPSRPGLEVFDIHEPRYPNIAASFRDAATGAAIFTLPQSSTSVEGPGRGVAADIYAGNPGPEMWVAGGGVPSGIYNSAGVRVNNQPSSVNFLVWWDADPIRELLNSNTINKYNPAGDTRLLTATDASSINGTKSTPNLSGDLFGDWREEVIWRSNDNTELRIYTTTTPANSRMYTLMHDSQYRVAVAWQNTAYNQPPHPSFFVGDGMAAAPAPNIYLAGAPVQSTEQTYQAENAVNVGNSIDSNNAGFNGTGFTNFPTTNGYLEFQNVNGGAGGTATIRFRYALGAAGARSGTLTVNGVSQGITFQPTGAWTTWNLMTLNVPLNPGGSNTIRLTSTGQDLANIDELQVAPNGVDVVGPSVATASHHYTASPNQLSFVFSEDVGGSIDLSDLQVMRGSTPIAPVNVTYNAATRTATFTLPPDLADGNYTATFQTNSVRDPFVNMMTTTLSSSFFVFAGDANHDRHVNVEDLKRFSANFGRTSGVTFGDGDFNYDGKVDDVDLAILSLRWSQSLAEPAQAPSPVTPTSSTITPPPTSPKKTRTITTVSSTVVK